VPVSQAELELHAPEGDFDDDHILDKDKDKTTTDKKTRSLFSSEQLEFLGSYLKDMLQSVLSKPASAQDAVNTTLSRISRATKGSDQVRSSKSVPPPPQKRRKIELKQPHSNQNESEEEEMEYESEPEDNQLDELDVDRDVDERDDCDLEDSYSRKNSNSSITETELKEEEKQEDSMNLSLADQLARIQTYFPDKVLLSDPPKQRIERPQEEVRKPTITGLPLHQLIQDNLQQLREEVMQGNSKFGTDKENSGFDTGKFPKSYTLRKKYQPTDIPDFGRNYKEDALLERLVWNPKKLTSIKDQEALDVKGAKRVATDLKKSLAVNSWGVWFAKANKILLNNLYNKIANDEVSMEEALEEVKMAANLNCSALNAAKESALFSSMALVTDTLAQRDAYLKIMDRDIPSDTRIKLRSAPFNGTRLFEGQTEEAKKALKDVKDNKDRVIQVNITQGKGQTYTIPKKSDKDYSTQKQELWKNSKNWRSSQSGSNYRSANYSSGNNNNNNNNNNRGRTFFRGSRFRAQNTNSNYNNNKTSESYSRENSKGFRGRGRGRGSRN